VRQRHVSQDAYRFYDWVKQQVRNVDGSVLDPPPANIKVKIRNQVYLDRS